MHIVIAPFEPLQADGVPPRLRDEIPLYLPVHPIEVTVAPPIPSPPAAYNPRRNQWDATRLVQWAVERARDSAALTVALHPGDLYVPGFNFVFGLAEPTSRTCIVGLARLETPDAARWHHRVLTEILHELGHLMGLDHCPTPTCGMFFSNTIRETDAKGPGFCPRCRTRLTARPPEEAQPQRP